MITPFNSALETGVRSLAILNAVFPDALDLQRLMDFDYLVVHSGDIGGPESLHAPLPLRSGELLVRRGLIEKGLLLMMSRGLVQQITSAIGIQYVASDSAGAFLSALSSTYITRLKECAEWVAVTFSETTDEELHAITRRFFDEWSTQFQAVERPREERQ
ncbi:MAG TPA: hypothetical protein PLM79_15760 [Syntrophobacteraceae bacterium]|nr:hypothetical protein [Syntrophobacteraceae bacterium]